MKKLVPMNIVEVEDGLTSLLGQRVMLWCMNYIYTGILTGVNDTCVRLDDAAVVYETGPLNQKGFKDAQPLLSGMAYIQRAAIELSAAIEVVNP